MSITVYWTRRNPGFKELESAGFGSDNYMSPMRYHAPVPLLKHIDYREFFGPNVSRCPAIVDDIKNTFVIKSPIDITLKIAGNKFEVEQQTLEFAQSFLGNPQGKFGLHQLALSYLFFAEKSLVLSQLPAYYDQNSFTDSTFTISASFDIGRWYRPAAKPAFIIKKGVKQITIKEGDPLIYIKFNTSEKVNLVEFDDVEFRNLNERSPEWICTAFKRQAVNIVPLAKCYEFFEQYHMRRRILKLIKNNIIGETQ